MILTALLLAFSPLTATVAHATSSTRHDGAQEPTTGRVVATISTLEGTVQLPGVDVELHLATDPTVIARTVTDDAGVVLFPDVPPGRYVIRASRTGFIPADSAEFTVRAGQSAKVLLDVHLTFAAPAVEVRAALPTQTPSPTSSVQPVSMSDMLSGQVLQVAPLRGDDFQSLLTLLPSIVRGPDGRLRIKGGQPSQGALQISSTSLTDPSTGDFNLDLPGQSIDSVEVLANPFAAEYGRFTTSVTQVRTRRGTNDWEIKPGNFVPSLGPGITHIRAFEPRFSVRGPIVHDRAFLAQDFQFRHVETPVKSLPGEPVIRLRSFDSFTRIDTVLSARHTLGGGLIAFPRRISQASLSTFRPPEVTPEFNQGGWSTGVVDRVALRRDVVVESTVAPRWFEINVNSDGQAPMIYAPQTQSGAYFNDQEREVQSYQWVESLTLARTWRGQHVFKFGSDVQWSQFTGFSASRPIELRRLDGSLAERTVFSGRSSQAVRGTEVGLFGQDRWRVGSRLTFELGMRLDRDAIVQHLNYSPRAGMAIAVAPEGRAILRGGFGKFVQRTPLNVEAFPSFEQRTVTQFGTTGLALGPGLTFVNAIDADLHTPEATVENVEWNQRFGRRLITKIEFLRRQGNHAYILTPNLAAREIRLSSTGTSRYEELEATTRYIGGERRDLTFSYVWAHGTADLNDYDQFYGNIRNPIIRANENNLIPTDVRHRLLVRGTVGLPGKWDFAPVLELRSGFPWTAVDDLQNFVGPRNRTGRLPFVHTLDFTLARPWQYKKYRFRAGLKIYNAFGTSAGRDVQNALSAPDYGTFYNPIERSIGFIIGGAK